ncbi:MAG: iron ABC transporter permease [Thermaceae bacterium]|nr:iron ABC transporter permease [Thermaceae bacterium]
MAFRSTPSHPSQPRLGRGGYSLGRRVGVFAVLLGLLLLALVLGVSAGAVKVAPLEVFQALSGTVPNPIISELRLPRVLGAMLVGAALGLCGAAFQGLFRNPLADPYLMGSAAGAAFGVTVAVTLAGGLTTAFATNAIFERVPASATWFGFVGAVGAVGLTLLLSGGASRTHDLILGGVVVSSVLTSLTTLLLLHDANRIFSVFAYTVGNLAFVGWEGVRTIGLYLGLTLPLLVVLGRTLNALGLGEETARSLGLPLGWLKLGIIAAVTLLTASAVAYAGIIGFVGLVAPHALRRIMGGDYRYLLPASALGGAVLLSLADWLARVLIAPAELPVGVLTTLMGGPFFLYLMWRNRARG